MKTEGNLLLIAQGRWIRRVLSCMDAPENARNFERRQRVRIAVMYPACLRGPVTAGLDGIRLLKGRGRDAQSTYRALCSDNTSS